MKQVQVRVGMRVQVKEEGVRVVEGGAGWAGGVAHGYLALPDLCRPRQSRQSLSPER